MKLIEISKLANVSVSTVSKILNGHDSHISAVTRERVLRIVKENNYVANSLARGLKTRKTYTIAFVLPDIANPFFPEIARGITDYAAQMGFGVILCNTDNKARTEKEYFEFLKSKMIDGMIYTRSLKNAEEDLLSTVSFPCVIVDRLLQVKNEAAYGRVYVDSKSAIHDSTMLLAARGCRRIAFLSAECSHERDRFYGYRAALAELGLDFEEELCCLREFNVETGYDGIRCILDRAGEIDGVVCGNDLIAIGVLDGLRERGIPVPGKIRVVGYDGISMAKYTNPRLSTFTQPAYDIGQEAARMLIRHILYGEPLFQQELGYHFTERETT